MASQKKKDSTCQIDKRSKKDLTKCFSSPSSLIHKYDTKQDKKKHKLQLMENNFLTLHSFAF